MQEFDLAKTVLDDIIDHDTPFSEALRKVFQNDVSLAPAPQYGGGAGGLRATASSSFCLFG
jgi:hypothetical protein